MRLETDHRQSVTDQSLELLERMERLVLALSGAGERASTLDVLLAETRTLLTACSGLHELGPMQETLVEYEKLVTALRASGGDLFDEKIGGVLLHSVGSFRHGLTSLGTESRAARLLPKILADLARVMASLSVRKREPLKATEETVQAARQAAQAAAADYRQVFLNDDAGTFAAILEYHAPLMLQPAQLLGDGQTVSDLFRHFHTVKGNAMALGFPKLADFAHATEDLLNLLFLSQFPADARSGTFLAELVEAMGRMVRELKSSGSEPAMLDELAESVRRFVAERTGTAPVEPEKQQDELKELEKARGGLVERKIESAQVSNFFLSVLIGGRETMIPCAAVVEVLRRPRVLAVPGGRPGWFGMIRVGGSLVPLVAPPGGLPEAVEWVVVLANVALPVERIGTVLEFPYDQPRGEVRILDVGEFAA